MIEKHVGKQGVVEKHVAKQGVIEAQGVQRRERIAGSKAQGCNPCLETLCTGTRRRRP